MKLFDIEIDDKLPVFEKDELCKKLIIDGLKDGSMTIVLSGTIQDNKIDYTKVEVIKPIKV